MPLSGLRARMARAFNATLHVLHVADDINA